MKTEMKEGINRLKCLARTDYMVKEHKGIGTNSWHR